MATRRDRLRAAGQTPAAGPVPALVDAVRAQTALLALNTDIEAAAAAGRSPHPAAVVLATGRGTLRRGAAMLLHVPRCRDCQDHYLRRTPDLRAQLAELDRRA